MALDRSGDYMKPAFRVGAAALGSFLAGPLGCATGAFLGGMLGDIFGQPVAELVARCAEKFGEAAGEKMLGSQFDSLVESFKERKHPQIQVVYREAFRQSLIAIDSQVGEQFKDWFQNWSACLDSNEPLDIGTIDWSDIVPNKLESNLSRTMMRLDRQGHALRSKDQSIIAHQDRAIPPELLTEIETSLPEHFEIHFCALIVTDQYKQAWNEAELDFRKYTNRMLESMDRKLDMISSQITELEKKLMRDKQVQALSPEPRDQLFAVLKEFADSEDPRASSVAQLAGFGRFDEATDMAIELARDDQAAVNQLEASTDEARKRAARRWIQAGDIAVVTDDAKASDAYLRAVTLDPSAIDGWWGLGFTSLSLDRLADALSAFTKLCHFMDGFARLARAAADPETAKQDFERFLKEEPNGSSAIYIRATRRLAEMFIYIAEILKRDPKLGYSWDMKVGDAPTEAKPGERVEYVARHPSEDEVRGITEWLSKSLHGFDGLLGEGAIRTEYSRALETLARIAIDHGHPDLALGYLDRAHQMSVEGADFVAEAVYLCNLGVAAAQMGQYSTAENHLDRSLAICEDDPSLGVRLIFPRRLLSPEEADRWKDRPRAQDDGLREGEIAMCNRLKDESERDSESAFRKGLKLKETEGNVHANLALVALRVGDPLKADREFRRAFDVHSEIGFLPGMAQDLEFYGHFAREQGDPKVACTCWEQALELFDQLGKRQHAQALKDHLRIVCNEGPVKSPPDTSD